ncbi:tripartite tricarboxylate transporter TctB family protein [Microvirga sp. GCM10011540]|uniref:tripartite tricarboxylate transporter TctB family protein n=1 Tax=Microvirga sp. GCM10011540 TaxID=3317338 RepID=UPI0036104C8F
MAEARRGLKSGDLVAGGFFLLLGVGAIAGAIRLEIGTPSEPQPGFFPFLGGLGLTILSALLIFQDFRGRSSGGEPFVETRRPVLAILGFVAFVALLDPLGYVLATALLAAVLLLILGVRLGWGSILTVVVLAAGSYLLFDRVLDVPLPEGILGAVFGP